MQNRYILNAPTFASETFPNEVIVLDTTNGTYYALTGNAPQAWSPLIQGQPLQDVANIVAELTGASVDQVRSDLDVFIADMMCENVLVARPSETVSEAAVLSSSMEVEPAYTGFVWEKHVDLDELLVLDPIHEVDPDKGWPHAG